MYQLKVMKTGEVLVTEGTIQPYVFILKAGKLTVAKTKGKDIKIIGEIFPGQFVGEMAYLGNEKMHQASVIAVEDCEVIEILGDSFLEVLAQNPVWLKALLKSLVIRLEKNNNKEL